MGNFKKDFNEIILGSADEQVDDENGHQDDGDAGDDEEDLKDLLAIVARRCDRSDRFQSQTDLTALGLQLVESVVVGR